MHNNQTTENAAANPEETSSESASSLIIAEKEKYLKECYDELCYVFSAADSADDIKNMFGCLFTPSERRDFAERWLLVKELDKGTPQRQIARKYNMSLCKITRGSKEMKKEKSAFLEMLSLVRKNRK